jgi:hypothetical protein
MRPALERSVSAYPNNNQKKKKLKRVGGIAQVVQHLPQNHKTLSSNPSTTKKEKHLRLCYMNTSDIPIPMHCFTLYRRWQGWWNSSSGNTACLASMRP